MRYDLIVLGSTQDGHAAAIAAAQRGLRVALIESDGSDPGQLRTRMLDELSGDRSLRSCDLADLRASAQALLRSEREQAERVMDRLGVVTVRGDARFTGPHTVEVETFTGPSLLEAERVMIACGSEPLHPGHLPFDGRLVLDADEVLTLDRMPRSMIVVGAGVTGIETATLFAALGTRVTVIDGRSSVLAGWEPELADAVIGDARQQGVRFRLGQDAIGVEMGAEGDVVALLEDGTRLRAETAVICVGGTGRTESLNLGAAGLEADERGRLWCDAWHQTWVQHIYGAGTVVGFPAASADGRTVVEGAFADRGTMPAVPSRRLAALPGAASAGQTAEEHAGVCVAGMAADREAGGGSILLKLLFDAPSRRLIGVHAVGRGADEAVRQGRQLLLERAELDDCLSQPENGLGAARLFINAAQDAAEAFAAEFAPAAVCGHRGRWTAPAYELAASGV